MSAPKPEYSSRKRYTLKDVVNESARSFRSWFQDFVNLKEGMDREGTIIAIKTNKRMRGANAWLLMCSIMIASLGLDLNSPAVIIGAMLISPLMAPILGIGLAVGTSDREALMISLRHFLIAIIIALTTSIIYFWASPLDQITDEIRARTAPTILDVGVAIFGGLAGIISTTRKDKSNAIPGVAIATALMPPLCVTGFGIANGDYGIAINSFYLFFLNSFTIAGTTYLIIRLLDFPYMSYVNPTEARKTRFRIAIFSFLLIIPSLFIFRNVWQKLQYEDSIRKFINSEFRYCTDSHIYGFSRGKGLSFPYDNQYSFAQIFNLNSKIPYDSNILVLELMNRTIPIDSFAYFRRIMQDSFGIYRTGFHAIPDYSIELENLDKRWQRGTTGQFEQLLDSFSIISERQLEVLEKQNTLADSLREDSIRMINIQQDVVRMNPYIDAVSLSRNPIIKVDTTLQIPQLEIQWKTGLNSTQKRNYEASIREFVRQKAGLDTLIIK
ncbi:DUF389 domain-containing protein [Flavilitoribacter nigricans]|uniref:TIGR00341 family protein n=1 Tax=Flavilitoribacter nigricans (strain ATCC 23147 / DSM 23189 / NBRC 102662 / NCIMB 1420 / SS-2) TaxID=1122177 RepID=A0A2D0NCI4_FLAN2|nr:DUF389 domain-containing protein [Flavilitoribacter nigricans]PHN06212.1 hypothetical protein CRP01_11560 [Flavilitoribacter nigricans DSM 23189 = NBRC 102662]